MKKRHIQNFRFHTGYWKPFIDDLLGQIKKGQSFTLMGMPGIGKSDIFQTLDKNKQVWQEIFPDKKIDFIIILLDLSKLLEVSPLGFYKLLLNKTYKNAKENLTTDDQKKKIEQIYKTSIESSDLFIIFEAVEDIIKVITEKGNYKLCYLIDDFSYLSNFKTQFFNTLKALRDIDKSKIVFGFTSDRDIQTTLSPEKLDELWPLFLNKIIWLKPVSKDDAFAVIKEWEITMNVSIPKTIKDKLYSVSSGHLGFMRAAYNAYEENGKDIKIFEDIRLLAQNPILKSRNESFWTKLLDDYKKFLTDFIKNPNLATNTRYAYLKKTGVINEKNKIFSPLLEEFIKHKAPTYKSIHIKNSGFFLDKSSSEIYIDGIKLKQEPTQSEFKILSLLFQEKGKVVSRDRLAEVIWGENKIKKYSDWAIDRTISRIRKKIGDSAKNPRFIKIIKGRGIKFTEQ